MTLPRAMKKALRSTDLLSRHGGEEFVALLPHTDSPAAALVAEHLRAAVSDGGIATDLGVSGLTISAGVATARQSDSIDSLVRRADDAMLPRSPWAATEW